MRTPIFTLLLASFLSLGAAIAAESDAPGLDAEGYIRDWLMLAPIPLAEEGSAGEQLLEEQVEEEASLKPEAGEAIRIDDREMRWRKVTTSGKFLDFNAILDSQYDRVAGYMVAYVECDEEIPEVTMSVGSNDQGRIYFNGVDIYAFVNARPLELDEHKGRVTLKKGLNVIVFKVFNEQNSWQAAMRLTDKAGAPLKGLRVKLSP